MRLALLATMLVFTGCASAPERQANASLSPDEAKQVVLSAKSRLWKDPESIREARIGSPYSCGGGLAHVGQMPDVCVCVELNAKNAFGGYTGLKQHAVLISGRTAVDIMPPRLGQDFCEGMVPFAELNGTTAPSPPVARR